MSEFVVFLVFAKDERCFCSPELRLLGCSDVSQCAVSVAAAPSSVKGWCNSRERDVMGDFARTLSSDASRLQGVFNSLQVSGSACVFFSAVGGEGGRSHPDICVEDAAP